MNDLNDLENVEQLVSMLEGLQDEVEAYMIQNSQLVEENSGLQKENSKILSENSILKNELQKKSEMIVSLNEQIGKQPKVDLVMKENEKLKQSEKKAREQVKAVEDRYFRKMTEIECEKGKLERELHSKVEPKYKSVVIAVFIYGFVVTMLKAIKDGILVEDAVAFGKATISILSLMWRLVDSAARCMMELADKASIEWLPVVVYWIVKICILGMVIGGITVGGILLLQKV